MRAGVMKKHGAFSFEKTASVSFGSIVTDRRRQPSHKGTWLAATELCRSRCFRMMEGPALSVILCYHGPPKGGL